MFSYQRPFLKKFETNMPCGHKLNLTGGKNMTPENKLQLIHKYNFQQCTDYCLEHRKCYGIMTCKIPTISISN